MDGLIDQDTDTPAVTQEQLETYEDNSANIKNLRLLISTTTRCMTITLIISDNALLIYRFCIDQECWAN